jgi:hypothetical protein
MWTVVWRIAAHPHLAAHPPLQIDKAVPFNVKRSDIVVGKSRSRLGYDTVSLFGFSRDVRRPSSEVRRPRSRLTSHDRRLATRASLSAASCRRREKLLRLSLGLPATAGTSPVTGSHENKPTAPQLVFSPPGRVHGGKRGPLDRGGMRGMEDNGSWSAGPGTRGECERAEVRDERWRAYAMCLSTPLLRAGYHQDYSFLQ